MMRRMTALILTLALSLGLLVTGASAAGRGDEHAGYTPIIEFYKNNLRYDEIKDIGEGYYACRFNTTWYLRHV